MQHVQCEPSHITPDTTPPIYYLPRLRLYIEGFRALRYQLNGVPRYLYCFAFAPSFDILSSVTYD